MSIAVCVPFSLSLAPFLLVHSFEPLTFFPVSHLTLTRTSALHLIQLIASFSTVPATCFTLDDPQGPGTCLSKGDFSVFCPILEGMNMRAGKAAISSRSKNHLWFDLRRHSPSACGCVLHASLGDVAFLCHWSSFTTQHIDNYKRHYTGEKVPGLDARVA